MSKVIFITGASSGIGKATALAALNAGHAVALMARNHDKLKDIEPELSGDYLLIPGDPKSFEDQRAAIEQTVAHFGRLDVAFANAGRGISQPGTEAGDPDEWRDVIEVNVMALLWTAKLALPHLREVAGQFVLTSSVAGRTVHKGSIYGASKWFAHGFGINLAEEMASWGGRCTTIAPGMVDTPFFDEPKPNKLQPEDIASAVLYAVDAPARANVREVYVAPTNV